MISITYTIKTGNRTARAIKIVTVLLMTCLLCSSCKVAELDEPMVDTPVVDKTIDISLSASPLEPDESADVDAALADEAEMVSEPAINDNDIAYSIVWRLDNPIDQYFLSAIRNSSNEAERRFYQDTYRGVWETEFRNIIQWMYEKCLNQDETDIIAAYEESVDELITASREVFSLDWDDMMHNADENGRHDQIRSAGNRGELSQNAAEIYRDASMNLVSIYDYEFMVKDYSLEHYE